MRLSFFMQASLSALFTVCVYSVGQAAEAAVPEWKDVPGILARIHAPTFPARDFAITAFGAVGDGMTDSLPAIRKAIEACTAAGGGRVLVPSGEYLLNGPIHLRSHVNLHVAKGATLRFSGQPEHFLPTVLTRWEGTLLHNYSPLIYVRGAEDVAVTGEGTIDGNARAQFVKWREKQGPAQDKLRKMGATGVPVDQREFGEGSFLRPGLIEPFECKNVLVEGVTLRDSPFWVVHPIFCTNVTVRGVTVDSLAINNDGCDPDSCTDVLIEHCRFHTGDDGIAIKAGRDADAWRDGRRCENIVIRHCEFQSKINSLCVGSEISGGVANVFMEDCHVLEGENCLYFKSNRDRGGFIKNVRARRIQIDLARSAAIRFESNYKNASTGNSPTIFEGFTFEDIACTEANAYFLYAEGFADLPVKRVQVRNVVVAQAKRPLYLRSVEDLDLTTVKVNGRDLPARPPMNADNETRLKLKG